MNTYIIYNYNIFNATIYIMFIKYYILSLLLLLDIY